MVHPGENVTTAHIRSATALPKKEVKSNFRNRKRGTSSSNNAPKEAPSAQKLMLGWTMSGQTCLDLMDRPIHLQAKRTCVDRQEQSPNASNL